MTRLSEIHNLILDSHLIVQNETLGNKTTIYAPMVIKCCRYIPQSLWNCIPSHHKM